MWEVLVRRVLNFPIESLFVLLAVILKTVGWVFLAVFFCFNFHGNRFGVKVDAEKSTENC